MSTAKINQTNISQSNAKMHAINGANGFVAHGKSQMCPPAKRTGFVRVNERNKTTGNGGYAQVLYKVPEVPAVESAPDVNADASSYNDYILYNYGTVSERYYASDSEGE